MTTTGDILKYMDSWAPTASKESWDNVGLLVGSDRGEVNIVLVALDITLDVISEAKNQKAQLIVSHHPVIFQPISGVTADDVYGARVIKLIESGIAAICMHTNLDFAPGGVETALTKALGLPNPTTLCANGEGRVSELPAPVPLTDYLAHVKKALNCTGIKYSNTGKPVKKIATCCGGGGDCIEQAAKTGCDTIITGDLKYFHFIEAAHYGINLIDAGHFPTENPIVPEITRRLREAFPGVNFIQSTVSAENIEFYN